MKAYAFGVDLGGTTAKLGLFQSDGRLVEKWEIPTRAGQHGENILPDIARAIRGKLEEREIPLAGVEGVGLGVPGAVLRGSYVDPCVNLDQWGGFDAAEALAALLDGLPVQAANDANAAALGEMHHGGGRGYRNVVLITLGTGVGGGVIVDGKLLTGVHGAGGEIGHIKVYDDCDSVCGCGKEGCLEQYASATGLVRTARQALARSESQTRLRAFDPLTCKDIFDCAKDGDEFACMLVDRMNRILGRAMASVSCVCDPEVFVIGGGVARAGRIILDGVARYFREYAFPAAEGTVFALAELGNDAGIYGCVHLILDSGLG